MSENLYCDSCRRFLRGELTSIEQDKVTVVFNHHDDIESFNKAMQLPCAICRLAWKHPDFQPPSALDWLPIRGDYQYRDSFTLVFFTVNLEGGKQHESLTLAFEPESDINHFRVRNPLSSNTRSDSAIKFLLDSYHHCRTKHTCSSPHSIETSDYPSRLLDVGTDEECVVSLRETAMFRNEDYVCLSHCWGDTRPSTLTAETQAALFRGVNVMTLPKTFRDAVSMTRSLHIRYLWIDSLCIFQDNNDDWATESARMGQIYSRAACTIAATASTNSEGGLFFDRCSSSLGPLSVEMKWSSSNPWLEGLKGNLRLLGTHLCDVQDLAEWYIDSAPLNLRAWVFQERLLSRRVMHFSHELLFWQCSGCFSSETYPKGLPRSARPYMNDDIAPLEKTLRDSTQQESVLHSVSQHVVPRQGLDVNTYRSWCWFRCKYSRCDLTKSSDKLVAVRGIAQQLEKITGDKLIAGLWRSRMVEEMCWQSYYPYREKGEWRAPTWSWAKSDASIWLNATTEFHGHHASRCIDAQLMELNVPTKLSGDVEGGSFIKIKCRPLRARFHPTTTSKIHDESHLGTLELFDRDDSPLAVWLLDKVAHDDLRFYMDKNNFSSVYGYVVIIQHCFHEEKRYRHNNTTFEDPKEESSGDEDIDFASDKSSFGAEASLEALFLTPSDINEESFERVGLLHAEGSRTVGTLLNLHHTAQDRVVTLV